MRGPDLIGRDAELAAWDRERARLAAGHGAMLAFTGRAGIGKTALLEAAAADAAASGWRVLRATNLRLTATVPGNVLWQWFAQLVRTTSAGEIPFDGPGDLLRRFVLRTESSLEAGGLGFAAAWALRSLAERGPVVCLLDDAQWSDRLSLDVVAALPQLVADEPVAFVLGVREDPAEPAGPALSDVLDRLGPRRVPLGSLRQRDVAAWLDTAGVAGSAELASRVQVASAGVPFFVRELVEGLRPGPGHQDEEVGTRSAQALLVDRVGALAEPEREVLRGVALLGDQAVDEYLLALTGLTPDDLLRAFHVLRADRLLGPGYPPRISHDLVATAALEGLGPAETSRRHLRIARILRRAGEQRSLVAGHLLRTDPDDAPEVAEELLAAAGEAVGLGDPAAASELLGRAAAQDGLPAGLRAQVTDLRGRALLLSGRADLARDVWRSDLAELDDEARVRRLLDLGDASISGGDVAAATNAFAEAEEVLSSGSGLGPDTRARVMARLSGAGLLGGAGLTLRHDRLTAILGSPPTDDRDGDRTLLAQESIRMAMAGEDARVAGDLAARALAGGHLLREEGSGGSVFAMAVSTLIHTDRDAEALAHLDQGLEHARRRGSVLEHATLAYTRAILHSRRGRFRLAQVDLESCLAARDLGWHTFTVIATHLLVQSHLVRGDVEAARALLPLTPLTADQPALFAAVSRHAHADVAVADGDDDRALALLSEAVEVAESFHGPAFTVWRRAGIGVAVRRGHDALARRWAQQELGTARAFGARRLTAHALQAVAPTLPFERAVPALREALALLGKVEARLLQAETHRDLASLLLDHADGHDDRRAEAAELARRGLALAQQVGAAPLAERLTSLLGSAGVEAEPSTSLVDRLSASELRVCELVVQGMTNRQVAEHLYVTTKAVEWHLSRSYAKLGISSRRELAPHLQGAAELT